MSSANEKVSTTTPSLQEQAAFDAFNRSQELALQTLNAPLQQLTRWSIVTLALVALSVILVLAGAAAALFLNTQVGVLTAVTSTISSIVFRASVRAASQCSAGRAVQPTKCPAAAQGR